MSIFPSCLVKANCVNQWYTIFLRRQRNERIEYLVKWRGYDDGDNTWEPLENLECFALIHKFERENQKKAAMAEMRSSAEKSVNVLEEGEKLCEMKRKRRHLSVWTITDNKKTTEMVFVWKYILKCIPCKYIF